MKGPILFLGTLVLVVILAAVLVLPAVGRRSELLDRLQEPAGKAEGANPDFDRAIADLEAALKLPPDATPPTEAEAEGDFPMERMAEFLANQWNEGLPAVGALTLTPAGDRDFFHFRIQWEWPPRR